MGNAVSAYEECPGQVRGRRRGEERRGGMGREGVCGRNGSDMLVSCPGMLLAISQGCLQGRDRFDGLVNVKGWVHCH